VNFGARPVAMPAGEVLISSSPIEAGRLPANSAAWVMPA
jgi:alpha-glucosidase